MKLNLGCGQNKKEGYVNVDKFTECNPDVVWDLETFPWPFETNSFDEILLHHVLEHLGQTTDIFFGIMKELYRISSPNARIRIDVPHPRSDGYSGDPTHVRPINPLVMSLFSKENNLKWKSLGWPNTPLGLYLDVDIVLESLEQSLMPPWNTRYASGSITREQLQEAEYSYWNVVNEVRMVMKVIKA